MLSIQELQISMFYHVMHSQLVNWNKRKTHGELHQIIFYLLVFSSFLTLNTCSETKMYINYHELSIDLSLTGALLQVY